MEMDWPKSSRDMGTVISYGCPFMTKTSKEDLTGRSRYMEKGFDDVGSPFPDSPYPSLP